MAKTKYTFGTRMFYYILNLCAYTICFRMSYLNQVFLSCLLYCPIYAYEKYITT